MWFSNEKNRWIFQLAMLVYWRVPFKMTIHWDVGEDEGINDIQLYWVANGAMCHRVS